jgi:hypothetical protein
MTKINSANRIEVATGEAKSKIEEILTVSRRQAIALWGAPGIGKSDVCQQVATNLGMKLYDIRISHFDPIELKGIPVQEGNRTKWLIPDLYPKEGPAIILLDEFTCAPPSTQNATLQLTLDYRLHDYVVPEDVAIILAGNLQEHGCYVNRLSPAQSNRLYHIFMKPVWSDTREYFSSLTGDREIQPEVISFLDFKPELLNDLETPLKNPEIMEFPTPRSWEKLSQILFRIKKIKTLSKRDIEFHACALVGSGAGLEFAQHVMLFHKINPEKVLEEGKIPTFNRDDVALLWASSGAISYFFIHRLGNKERPLKKHHVENMISFLESIPSEFQARTMKSVAWGRNKLHLEKTIQYAPERFKVLADSVRETVSIS